MIRARARSLTGWQHKYQRRLPSRTPQHLRIAPFLGHGSTGRVVVRGRVLDNVPPPAAVVGEDTRAAVRRTVARFLAKGMPGAPLRIRVGSNVVETSTDRFGYFDTEFDTELDTSLPGLWHHGEVELAAPYRGITDPNTTQTRLLLSGTGARFGLISDVDDTILLTGAQRVLSMVRTTVTGSALTRVAFAGAPELYRAFAGGSVSGENPLFYVSSSPWPLHDFLTAFLAHRRFPLGPLLLRDVPARSTDRSPHGHKRAHIDEILRVHPHLSFVLVGDSGQHDPDIYAGVVRDHPGRVLAVYIREVRLDPGDRRVESVTDTWNEDVPFVLAPDSAAVAERAAGLGLISHRAAQEVLDATARDR